ncbi:hypothetical protein K469DRAFT_748241 [Zopfia rhizophila CBS 207.26]|uniref:Uncharacterized protein n=1 Tax=Zopfia rhizophila CBS 207.26 TaxID=1314779 RepID=A0A6A6EAQ0_9PEZI|nr:hypothetical protein K469DRAFT_748241 [Zopfia rhizophila CBS 207.26]
MYVVVGDGPEAIEQSANNMPSLRGGGGEEDSFSEKDEEEHANASTPATFPEFSFFPRSDTPTRLEGMDYQHNMMRLQANNHNVKTGDQNQLSQPTVGAEGAENETQGQGSPKGSRRMGECSSICDYRTTSIRSVYNRYIGMEEMDTRVHDANSSKPGPRVRGGTDEDDPEDWSAYRFYDAQGNLDRQAIELIGFTFHPPTSIILVAKPVTAYQWPRKYCFGLDPRDLELSTIAGNRAR